MSIYQAESPMYLDLALQSVWNNQLIKPDQIVLVKDGPLNAELDLILSSWKQLLQDKLVVIPIMHNQGLTKALNIGLEYCTGQYIARMDTDDISHPNRFKFQLDYLQTHPDVYVLGTGIQEINEKGETLHLRTYPTNMDDIIRYIAKASPLAHPTVMFRRELFDAGYRYNERYIKNQDVELWFRILKGKYGIANLNEPLLCFRRTKDTYRKRKDRKASFLELKIYCKGIRNLYGVFSWKYIYPVARFILKQFPAPCIEFVYEIFYPKKFTTT